MEFSPGATLWLLACSAQSATVKLQGITSRFPQDPHAPFHVVKFPGIISDNALQIFHSLKSHSLLITNKATDISELGLDDTPSSFFPFGN